MKVGQECKVDSALPSPFQIQAALAFGIESRCCAIDVLQPCWRMVTGGILKDVFLCDLGERKKKRSCLGNQVWLGCNGVVNILGDPN